MNLLSREIVNYSTWSVFKLQIYRYRSRMVSLMLLLGGPRNVKGRGRKSGPIPSRQRQSCDSNRLTYVSGTSQHWGKTWNEAPTNPSSPDLHFWQRTGGKKGKIIGSVASPILDRDCATHDWSSLQILPALKRLASSSGTRQKRVLSETFDALKMVKLLPDQSATMFRTFSGTWN